MVSVSSASLLYPYGLEPGDEAPSANDNGYSEELPLMEPFYPLKSCTAWPDP